MSCRSAQKYVERGDFDKAIDYCVSNLRGKKKKDPELVRGLEIAFQKAQERDYQRIDQLLLQNNTGNWERINDLHRNIKQRQDKIQPLLPLRDKKGYTAIFKMENIAAAEAASRKKAAEYIYANAEKLLAQAEQGDRQAARRAYDELYKIECKYYPEYCEKDALMDKAKDMGTTHILFRMRNKSDMIVPNQFEEQLLSMSKADLDSKWKSYHFSTLGGLEMDYIVEYNIRDIRISPEQVKERSYTDETTIKDGWEYILDARGNVMKDTLGNDLKQDKYVKIRADVLEVYQLKTVGITGTVEVFEARRNSSLDRKALDTNVLFEHYAATYRGDSRALTTASKRMIGNSPVPFPTHESMLMQAVEQLKPDVRQLLRNNPAIL